MSQLVNCHNHEDSLRLSQRGRGRSSSCHVIDDPPMHIFEQMAEETLTADELSNLKESFKAIDTDGSGYIDGGELKVVLNENGYDLPMYKLRTMMSDTDKNADNKIDFNEFLKLYVVIKREYTVDFSKNIKRKSGIKTHSGTSQASAKGTTHSVSKQEEISFSHWIDKNLHSDPDCPKYLPIDEVNGPGGLYKNVQDGVVLCKLINISCPETIDERAINKGEICFFKKRENLALALNSAAAIGCNIVNIGPGDLLEGKVHLVLGLLWQIIKIGLLAEINLQGNPYLAALLLYGESMDDLKSLTPEQLLMRWVNFHLQKAQCNRTMTNFTSDIMDSEIYTVLLKQIAPIEKGVTDHPLSESDRLKRAELMLEEADKLDCRQFVSAQDVVNNKGNSKLNSAFIANLYNNHPALDKVADEEKTVPRVSVQANAAKLDRFLMETFSSSSSGEATIQKMGGFGVSSRGRPSSSQDMYDVLLVLDSSGSIGSDEFLNAKQFMTDIVSLLPSTISQDNTRVACISFSYITKTEFNFSSHTDKNSVIQAINRIPYIGGGTCTTHALQHAKSLLETTGRAGVLKVLLIATDGGSGDGNPAIPANEMKNSESIDVVIFVLAASRGVKVREVEAIASSPPAKTVLYVNTFTEATRVISEVKNKIRTLCE